MIRRSPREDELRQLAGVQAELLREFGDRLGAEQVQRRFAAAVASFDGAPIRSFVPVLTQRFARLELQLSCTSTPEDRPAVPTQGDRSSVRLS